MAYTDTWNAAFEAVPADLDNESDGADKIRHLKTGIRERLEHDHYFDVAGTDADHGEHKWVTLRYQSSKPTAVAAKGFLYTKDVGASVIELFYEDEAGTEVQLTSGTIVLGAIPSGTKMVFYQDTAPTGWTISNTLNDKLLFVTKGSVAGGETGGAVHSTGTWTFETHTHTYNTVIAHSHTLAVGGGGYGPYHGGWDGSTSQTWESDLIGSTGSASGTTLAQTAVATWRPAAYNVIIATKD